MNAICATKYYSAYQSNSDRRFYIDFNHKIVAFTFCQLLQLREKLKKHTTHENLTYLIETTQCEIVGLSDLSHFVLLDALQLLDLQALVHSILYEGEAPTY